jgi:hypothetical protein
MGDIFGLKSLVLIQACYFFIGVYWYSYKSQISVEIISLNLIDDLDFVPASLMQTLLNKALIISLA